MAELKKKWKKTYYRFFLKSLSGPLAHTKSPTEWSLLWMIIIGLTEYYKQTQTGHYFGAN